MFNVLDFTRNDLVAIQVEGKIDKKDYKELGELVENKGKDHEKINMYLEFKNIEGVTPKAALDDIMTYFKYVTRFNKIAVLGEESWGNLLASTSNEFYSAEIRFFRLDRKQEAKAWLS